MPRKRPPFERFEQSDSETENPCCPVCERQLPQGETVDRHHWIPKSRGGRDIALLHRICHRMIHRVFSHSELERYYNSAETIREHPDMQRFISWVRKKDPGYMDWPESGNRYGRNKKRKR